MASFLSPTRLPWLLGLLLATSLSAAAQRLHLPTQRYNNQRTGWNARETKLTAAVVDSARFGLRFQLTVDDQVYAQPLLLGEQILNGRFHNVLYVATVNNSVYAFDADSLQGSAALWHVSLTPAGHRVIRNTDMTGACGGNYLDFSGRMGIVGTPVIDTATATLYVVARSLQLSNGAFKQYLHALDVATGQERPGSPVLITATVRGDGDGSANHVVTFNQQHQNQRAALLLHQGVVYICWAGHCDWPPYHGWMIGYSASTLQRVSVYNDTPDGANGGIWMSGNGPVVDPATGDILLATGNGTVGADRNANRTGNPNYYRDRGESLLRLRPAADSMQTVDFFTPYNYPTLESQDLDYGVDGVTLIPGTTLTLSGSKEGKLYLVDGAQMRHCAAANPGALQQLYVNTQNLGSKHVHGAPLYFRTAAGPGTPAAEGVYVWAESDSLYQFFFDRITQRFDLTRTRKGRLKLDDGMPGGLLTYSSRGTVAGTGVVWASFPTSGNANQQVRPGKLVAFDGRDVRRRPLWTSELLPARDRVGNLAKFNPPVVANGKVYMATFSNRINVYGLFNPPFDTLVVRRSLTQADTAVVRAQVVRHDTVYYAGTVAYHDTTRTSTATYQISQTVVITDTVVTRDVVHTTDTLTITQSTRFHYAGTITDSLHVLDSLPNPAGPTVPRAPRLYPNPTVDYALLDYDLPLALPDVRLVLRDPLGRTVSVTPLTGTAGTHQREISTQALASGVYYYSLETGRHSLSRGKLLKW